MNPFGPPARDREEKTQDRKSDSGRDREERKQSDSGRDRDDRGRDDGGIVLGGGILLPGRAPDGWDSALERVPTLTFVRQGKGGSELWLVDESGSALVALGPRFADAADPARAPRRGRLAYCARERSRWTLKTIGANLSREKRLTDPRWGDVHEPAWAPDDNRLVFVSAREGEREALWRIGADGKGLTRLTPPIGARRPAWSGDGRGIYFSAPDRRGWTLWGVDAQGGDPAPLPDLPPGDVRDPAISPDGQLLACSIADRDDHSEIWVIDLRRHTPPRRLTDGPGDCLQPTFRPDGSAIAFSSNREGGFAIYSMRLFGGVPRRLTPGRDDERAPAWW